MDFKIDNTFTLSCDKYNWILIEKITSKTGKKNTKRRFYKTLKQLSAELIEIKSKDVLTMQRHGLTNISTPAKPYNFLMDNITQELEVFLREVTENEEEYKMKHQIKTPVVVTGANDKNLCKIRSQLYDTQVGWVLKALCEGAHVHNLMMPVGYKLIDIIKTLKCYGIILIKHYDPSRRIWSGTGRPNVINTWSLSEKDINLYKLIMGVSP